MEQDEQVSVLGMTRADKIWLFVLLGAGGLLVFLTAPWLARWLASVPFVPFAGPLEWVGSFNAPWTWVVRPALGLALGLVGAVLLVADEYRLEVDDHGVVVVRGEDRRRIAREQITGVYQERKDVVIHGAGGRVFFDRKIDAPKDAIRGAFAGRGYPWESE